MKTSLAVVTYHNVEPIKKLLDSILNFKLFQTFSMIVVDNSEDQKTFELVQSYKNKIPNLEIHKSNGNIGFGKGHNLALELVDSDIHIICNPDIIFKNEDLPNFLNKFWKNRNQIGLVVPRCLHLDGRVQYLNKRYQNIWDLFLRRFAPGFLKNIFKKRMQKYEYQDVGYDTSYEVEGPSGAFMVTQTSLLRSVGGFDPRYFMYMEDMDLGREIQKAGYLTMFDPSLEVYHAWERGAYKKLKLLFAFLKSTFQYFNKWGWRFF